VTTLLAVAFGITLAASAPTDPLPAGVSCNTSKGSVAKDQEVPDAPDLEPPLILERFDPVAPVGRESESVKVLVRVVVCTDGVPRTPTIVISGTKEFDAAAAAAVLRWKFVPGKRHGVTAAMSYTTLVKFGPVTAPVEGPEER
jgi:protein TonB